MRPILSIALAIAAITVCGGTVLAAAGGGNDLPQKVIALTSQARSAYSSRDFALSEQKYNDAIALAAAAPAKVRIALLSNLGAAYREDHKYVEAENTFKKALAISDASHLSYDPASKLTMQQYAMLLRKLNRPAEADAMEIRSAAGVVAVFTPTVGEDGRSSFTASAAPRTVSPRSTAPAKVEEPDAAQKLAIDDLKKKIIKDPQNYFTYIQLGNAYAEAKNFKEAAEAFKSALSHGSSTKRELQNQMRMAMVMCYYRVGDAENGMEPCKQYYSDNPENPTANRLMSSFYSFVGDWASQVAVDEQFVEKFPTHADVDKVSENLVRLKRDLANNKVLTSKADNQPTADEIKYSFIKARMPLKVFVGLLDDDSIVLEQGATTAVTDSTPGLLIQRSLDAWTQATQGRVTFVITDKPETADITCEFTADPAGLETSTAAGVTTWPRNGGRIQPTIKLLTVSSQTGKPIERGLFLQATLHEFGHALGLEHSNRPEDVMYRREGATPVVQLSDNDRDRILKLYTVF